MTEILNRLADAVGIEPSYWDIHGTLHETSDAAKRALAAALGFPAATEDEAAESLARLETAAWSRLCPPVAVAGEGGSATVDLALSAAAGAMRWSIRLESGAVLDGTVGCDDLSVVAQGAAGGRPMLRRRLALPVLPAGYHDLHVEADGREGSCRLIVSPGSCFVPAEFDRRKLFGVSAQLYALRSVGDWGIGDFSTLHQAAGGLAGMGVDVVGLNPLHALFLDTPGDASPYSPSSRQFKNPLYIDVTAVPEFAASSAAQAALVTPEAVAALTAARQAELVDYLQVARLKLSVLEILYREFCAADHGARFEDFRRFVADKGDDLMHFAAFQALSEHFGTHDWSRWPQACHDAAAPETVALCRRFANRIAFFEYLQWLCEEQLGAAAAAATEAGMRIGLYNDLAISVNTASADYWSHRDLFAGDASIGSPPDPFNAAGQEWGVIPMRPLKMRETAYAHYIALLRANMRHAGALRIDHVMGLQRLFLIPRGLTPQDGAYVRYPIEDLLAIAALESRRHRALVIGEDLGTVPDGFRERLQKAGVLSCKVFYFEREGEGFRRPESYPPLAAASVSTHDLPTLRGYFDGTDIDSRRTVGMISSEEEGQVRAGRAWEKRQLLYALREAGLLPEGVDPENGAQGWTSALARAVEVYVARAGARLMLVQMDDLMGASHQTNLPGTTWQHANWCRRHARPLEQAFADPDLRQTLAAIAAARG